MRHWVLVAVLAVACSAQAGPPDPECVKAHEAPAPKSLDWSDGKYRMCAPLEDNQGQRYPDDLRMTCWVYIDLQPVPEQGRVVRPGEKLEGDHGMARLGQGTASGRCKVGEAMGGVALPVPVKLR